MTAKELRKKFESDLEHLQNTCKHENVSDWMECEWAPGHSSMMKVKVCLQCEKVIEEDNYATKLLFEMTTT